MRKLADDRPARRRVQTSCAIDRTHLEVGRGVATITLRNVQDGARLVITSSGDSAIIRVTSPEPGGRDIKVVPTGPAGWHFVSVSLSRLRWTFALAILPNDGQSPERNRWSPPIG